MDYSKKISMTYSDVERLIPESRELSICFQYFVDEKLWRNEMEDKSDSDEGRVYSSDDFEGEYDDYSYDSTEENEEEENIIKSFINKHNCTLISFKEGECRYCRQGVSKKIEMEYEIGEKNKRCLIFYQSFCSTYNAAIFICNVP